MSVRVSSQVGDTDAVSSVTALPSGVDRGASQSSGCVSLEGTGRNRRTCSRDLEPEKEESVPAWDRLDLRSAEKLINLFQRHLQF